MLDRARDRRETEGANDGLEGVGTNDWDKRNWYKPDPSIISLISLITQAVQTLKTRVNWNQISRKQARSILGVIALISDGYIAQENNKHQAPPNQQDTPIFYMIPILPISAVLSVTMIPGKPSHAKTSMRPHTGRPDCPECSSVPRMCPMWKLTTRWERHRQALDPGERGHYRGARVLSPGICQWREIKIKLASIFLNPVCSPHHKRGYNWQSLHFSGPNDEMRRMCDVSRVRAVTCVVTLCHADTSHNMS